MLETAKNYNDNVLFDLSEPDEEAFSSLPEVIQERIQARLANTMQDWFNKQLEEDEKKHQEAQQREDPDIDDSKWEEEMDTTIEE